MLEKLWDLYDEVEFAQKKIIFSDEAYFHLCGHVSKQNWQYLVFRKPIHGFTEANAYIMSDCLVQLVKRWSIFV